MKTYALIALVLVNMSLCKPLHNPNKMINFNNDRKPKFKQKYKHPLDMSLGASSSDEIFSDVYSNHIDKTLFNVTPFNLLETTAAGISGEEFAEEGNNITDVNSDLETVSHIPIYKEADLLLANTTQEPVMKIVRSNNYRGDIIGEGNHLIAIDTNFLEESPKEIVFEVNLDSSPKTVADVNDTDKSIIFSAASEKNNVSLDDSERKTKSIHPEIATNTENPKINSTSETIPEPENAEESPKLKRFKHLPTLNNTDNKQGLEVPPTDSEASEPPANTVEKPGNNCTYYNDQGNPIHDLDSLARAGSGFGGRGFVKHKNHHISNPAYLDCPNNCEKRDLNGDCREDLHCLFESFNGNFPIGR